MQTIWYILNIYNDNIMIVGNYTCNVMNANIQGMMHAFIHGNTSVIAT